MSAGHIGERLDVLPVDLHRYLGEPRLNVDFAVDSANRILPFGRKNPTSGMPQGISCWSPQQSVARLEGRSEQCVVFPAGTNLASFGKIQCVRVKLVDNCTRYHIFPTVHMPLIEFNALIARLPRLTESVSTVRRCACGPAALDAPTALDTDDKDKRTIVTALDLYTKLAYVTANDAAVAITARAAIAAEPDLAVVPVERRLDRKEMVITAEALDAAAMDPALTATDVTELAFWAEDIWDHINAEDKVHHAAR